MLLGFSVKRGTRKKVVVAQLHSPEMYVVKRDGRKEKVVFDKITSRIKRLCYGLNETFVDPVVVAMKVCKGIYRGVKTIELDELAAETAAHLTTEHPDYGILAARIAVSNLHKQTKKSFSETVKALHDYINPKTGKHAPLISDQVNQIVQDNADILNGAIIYDRDFRYSYFGFKTLEQSYFLKMHGRVVERPQHMLMRVAVGIHLDDIEAALESYHLMSQGWFTHATPTLFNAGTPRPQLSSCFLLTMKGDSIEGIYDTLKQCAMISKQAGGIGLAVHSIRSTHSYIAGTNGESNGLVPMLRVFSSTSRYVDQCFEGSTIVYTKDGPKPMRDVGLTDCVLTHTGKFQRVEKILRYDIKGPILKIDVKQSIAAVRVTPEHQILALQGQKKMVNFDVVRNRLAKNLARPRYVDARDLQVGDFVCFPIPQIEEQDIQAFSLDDCRFYGILIGDGYVGDSDACRTAAVYLGYKKARVIDFVRNYALQHGIHLTEYNQQDSNCLQLAWSTNNVGFKFTRSQLYDQNGTKKIDPQMMLLPRAKILQIIRGVIETDGCIGTKEILLEMSSPQVIESVRWMLMRCGILSSGYHRNRVGHVSAKKNIITRLETDVLRVPRVNEITELLGSAAGKFTGYLVHDKMMYSRIDAITEEQFEGPTYDFEIAEDHTYVLHSGLVHNGGGKRKGAFAIYLEPWHADVEAFLDLKKNNGAEEARARDLFYGLWIPDLFMKRVESNGQWSLFCPNEAPGLSECWGEAFEALYENYEREGTRARKVMPARTLWQAIIESQIETGQPYLLHKDACNRKSNQQNLGTIKSSNLCVAGDTFILTQEYGEVRIQSVVDRELHVWNGQEWSKTTIKQTSSGAKLMRVNFDNGSELFCTQYHKFYVLTDHDLPGVTQAQHLRPNMELVRWHLPGASLLAVKGVRVSSVETTDRFEPTYCFNEEKRHAGIFNGILAGNCTEIVEYTSPDEVAVCNLASIALPMFVIDGRFDFQKLFEVSQLVAKNLNKVIDRNYYPVPEAETSNKRHRPIGIGVQGLADAYIKLGYPFESPEAALLNRQIFETIYYGALTASMNLAQCDGPYSTYKGSPVSQGKLQFDLWGVTPTALWDWEALKQKIAKYGIRNSLLIAPMPTASTSQILGNNESCEAFTSNLYVRRTLAGEFVCVNDHLLKALVARGLWNPTTRARLIAANGSVQQIEEIPADLKKLFKTVWEIPQKCIIDQAADRGAYICQSQSMNIHMTDPTYAKLTSMHFYGWKKGLKTGSYYVRGTAAADAIKFTLDKDLLKEAEKKETQEKKEVHPTTLSEMVAAADMTTENPEHLNHPQKLDDMMSLINEPGVHPESNKECLRNDPGCLSCQ